MLFSNTHEQDLCVLSMYYNTPSIVSCSRVRKTNLKPLKPMHHIKCTLRQHSRRDMLIHVDRLRKKNKFRKKVRSNIIKIEFHCEMVCLVSHKYSGRRPGRRGLTLQPLFINKLYEVGPLSLSQNYN